MRLSYLVLISTILGGYLARQRKGNSDPDQIANQATDRDGKCIVAKVYIF